MNPSHRYLVLGANGQLGQALLRAAPGSVGIGRDRLDLSRPDVNRGDRVSLTLKAILEGDGPFDAVVNAAAYTAVDAAEDDEHTASMVNGVSPGVLAWTCKAKSLPFVHISTDYVFDGTAVAPMPPDHPTAPLGVYGRTKHAGERAVTRSGSTAAVLRTSWVFDAANRNFLTTMLRVGAERAEMRVVDDQIGRPTAAVDLAEAALACARGLIRNPKLAGLYHVTNTGPAVSWAGFAEAIFALRDAGGPPRTSVTRIPSSEYPTPAQRPAYSVLDVSAFEAAFDHALPDWRDALLRVMAERPV